MEKAKIIEIFRSIQGEGLYVGEEQVFVRFFGCNLDCEFCDEKKKTYFSEFAPDELLDAISQSGIGTVSLTGGEPLLWADFLKKALPNFKKKGLRIYLETNGTLKDNLEKVLDYIDIISMDIKLPSSTGLKPYWQEHSLFLKETLKKEAFVKVVVTPKTLLEDVEKAVNIVQDIDVNIPFIIQPVSYNDIVQKIDLMPAFFRHAKEKLENVRIIPQLHKILGVK